MSTARHCCNRAIPGPATRPRRARSRASITSHVLPIRLDDQRPRIPLAPSPDVTQRADPRRRMRAPPALSRSPAAGRDTTSRNWTAEAHALRRLSALGLFGGERDHARVAPAKWPGRRPCPGNGVSPQAADGIHGTARTDGPCCPKPQNSSSAA
ncbi:hypothetical protein BJ969_003059 [Saccharopolyspora gloriosae]|uniref:Uncharacterized protein n=1 Tax=Saccharopolyspora gloriosae TaxID=455344 RepID=A0A840NG49_9PSEU|nr:hypothetical protein [Saccharopolyspora gloriosae]